MSLNDLGGDVEGVEEVDLRGVETSGACGDREVDGRKDSNSGFSGNLVGFDIAPKVVDRGFGEDEGDFLLEEGDEDIQLRNFASELFFEVFELSILNAFSSHSDDFLDESLDERERTFLEMTS